MNANIGLKTIKYKKLIIITLKIAGKISDQIEKPDALKTVSSLCLFSFMYVCMELSRKTVGRIKGNKVGIWKIAIFTKIKNSISLLELLLINSIRSNTNDQPDFLHGAKIQNILDMCMKSNDIRQWVDITN